MNEIQKLSSSLEETLKDSDLQNVTADLAETFADSLLDEGLLKDIPIVGSIVGLAKTAVNLTDRLFLKKIIYFISEIKNIEPQKREKLISDIDRSDKFKIRVGEKILYILDKCEDHLSAVFIAKLFNSFLKEEISYADFLRASLIIQKIYIADFELFVKTSVPDLEAIISHSGTITDFQNSLINSGICGMITDRISIRDQDDWKIKDKYVVEGGETIIYLTEIGYKLKKILL